jgi:YbbR domain-containing protein
MPFQDLDEVSATEYSRSPGAVESWLRRLFLADWGLKLLALGITLLLWLAVTGVNKPVTIKTAVQLNVIPPDKLEISNDPPRTVDVLLTGRRSNLDKISTVDLVATIDVSDQREGQRVVRLSTDRVHIELPEGVRIESFQPSTLPILLEPIIERQLEVQPKLSGKPADGLEAYAVHVSPDKITVRGPAGHVNALLTAPTETVSVDGKNAGFTANGVGINISDSKVDLLTSAVDVSVEIGERRTDKTNKPFPSSTPR